MKRWFITFAMSAVLAGCGKAATDAGKHDEGRHEAHDAEGGGAATFAEGKGIRLAGETRETLGFKTAEVATATIEPLVHLTAQVYRSADGDSESPTALATAMIDPKTTHRLRPGQRVSFVWESEPLTGMVKAVDAAQEASSGKVEVLVEVMDPKRRLTVGAFVPIPVRLSKVAVTAIPRSAVLETLAGKFAYVQNGEFLLRTPVATGLESEETIEITDGLYEGDVVVAQPVESLHLIELRATKGGGHGH